jgi:hypothetical protein
MNNATLSTPFAALNRYWYGVNIPGDTQLMRTHLANAQGSYEHLSEEIDADLADAADPDAKGIFIFALSDIYPGEVPFFCYAIALALDDLEGTPGLNANAIPAEWQIRIDEEDYFADDDNEAA